MKGKGSKPDTFRLIVWSPFICQKKKMTEKNKKLLTKVLAFIGMIAFIPLRIYAGGDADMASCATAFFILCAIIFGTPFEKIFCEDEPKGKKRKGAAHHDRNYHGTTGSTKRSA
mgnify:FL=1